MKVLGEWTSLEEVHLSSVALGATTAGLLFNLGFFSRVGVRFVPLFSLGEHLVFALSFALYVLAFSVLALAFFFIVRPAIQRAQRKAEDRMRVRILDYWPIIAALVLVLGLTAVGLLVNSVPGIDAVEWGFLALLALTEMVFLLLVRAVIERRAAFVGASVVGALLVSFAFGYFYAAASFWENQTRGVTVAVLTDGTELRLARGGERYFLLVASRMIVAQPAAGIVRIERRPSG